MKALSKIDQKILKALLTISTLIVGCSDYNGAVKMTGNKAAMIDGETTLSSGLNVMDGANTGGQMLVDPNGNLLPSQPVSVYVSSTGSTGTSEPVNVTIGTSTSSTSTSTSSAGISDPVIVTVGTTTTTTSTNGNGTSDPINVTIGTTGTTTTTTTTTTSPNSSGTTVTSNPVNVTIGTTTSTTTPTTTTTNPNGSGTIDPNSDNPTSSPSGSSPIDVFISSTPNSNTYGTTFQPPNGHGPEENGHNNQNPHFTDSDPIGVTIGAGPGTSNPNTGTNTNTNTGTEQTNPNDTTTTGTNPTDSNSNTNIGNNTNPNETNETEAGPVTITVGQGSNPTNSTTTTNHTDPTSNPGGNIGGGNNDHNTPHQGTNSPIDPSTLVTFPESHSNSPNNSTNSQYPTNSQNPTTSNSSNHHHSDHSDHFDHSNDTYHPQGPIDVTNSHSGTNHQGGHSDHHQTPTVDSCMAVAQNKCGSSAPAGLCGDNGTDTSTDNSDANECVSLKGLNISQGIISRFMPHLKYNHKNVWLTDDPITEPINGHGKLIIIYTGQESRGSITKVAGWKGKLIICGFIVNEMQKTRGKVVLVNSTVNRLEYSRGRVVANYIERLDSSLRISSSSISGGTLKAGIFKIVNSTISVLGDWSEMSSHSLKIKSNLIELQTAALAEQKAAVQDLQQQLGNLERSHRQCDKNAAAALHGKIKELKEMGDAIQSLKVGVDGTDFDHDCEQDSHKVYEVGVLEQWSSYMEQTKKRVKSCHSEGKKIANETRGPIAENRRYKVRGR